MILFEIEDAQGKFVSSFNSPRGVEDFFLWLPDARKEEDFTVLGFDEFGYLIQTWYAADVEVGNFIRDVENYEKRNSQKTVREKREKQRNQTPRKDKKFR